MSVSPQEFVVAPCLSGRQYCSPRLAGRSDLYFFQMTVFPLSPGTCEILYVPFKNEISISLSSLGLWKLSTTGLQSQVLWGLLLRLAPQAGSLTWGLELSLLWKNILNIINLQFVGHPPRWYGI